MQPMDAVAISVPADYNQPQRKVRRGVTRSHFF
jgi:hypothetical protein